MGLLELKTESGETFETTRIRTIDMDLFALIGL